ncbi:MAG: hypothetical protein DIU63_02390 [Proteobacteria bacterium]|jgi:Predicted outer membrane protein|nr:MAG: hypothetical protein DIU63_02390 [Pseudomonadota bacterium]
MHAILAWLLAIAAVLALPPAAGAQPQPPATSSWDVNTQPMGIPQDLLLPAPNTTVIPWTPSTTPDRKSGNASGESLVTLVALLTQDGQRIESGLVWRVYKKDENASGPGSNRLILTRREASPVLKLDPGDYFVNAAFGRAHLTRRITVKPGEQTVEQFVLNAGGLRVTALVNDGETAPPNTVTFDVYSDERDQFGNRTLIMEDARPGVIIRLNSGIYHIESTYGDANSRVSTDVTVEAGKLTEATLKHSAAKVTFKLVRQAGGEALADTQWSILDEGGGVVKESVGALPVHTLAPGKYTVTARSAGQVFRRDFSVERGEIAEVEVVMQ